MGMFCREVEVCKKNNVVMMSSEICKKCIE